MKQRIRKLDFRDEDRNFLLWNDDKMSLYKMKQPNEFQYLLKIGEFFIQGPTIEEVVNAYKILK